MKRILALAMTLAMLFSLAGCAFGDYISLVNDTIVARKIVGSWVSEEVDVFDLILDEIEMGLADALGQYEEIDRDSLPDCSFTLQLCLDIESSGRFSLYCADPEFGLRPVVEDIFRTILEIYLTAALAAEDATLDDLYAELGVHDFDSAIKFTFGMSLSTLLDASGFYDMFSQALNASTRGTFTVLDGVIIFEYADGVEEFTYNRRDDTLTDDDGYIFTRVG